MRMNHEELQEMVFTSKGVALVSHINRCWKLKPKSFASLSFVRIILEITSINPALPKAISATGVFPNAEQPDLDLLLCQFLA